MDEAGAKPNSETSSLRIMQILFNELAPHDTPGLRIRCFATGKRDEARQASDFEGEGVGAHGSRCAGSACDGSRLKAVARNVSSYEVGR